MLRMALAGSALAALTACGDGQPFFQDDTTTGGTTGGATTPDTGNTDDGSLDTDGATPPPPGTSNPQPDRGIFRKEARNDNGGGLVNDVSYDRATDTFTVDNLGFDGANVYKRAAAPLNTLGVTRVYAADEQVADSNTGKPVGQIVPYRALYGVSKNRVDGEPRTSFAVVRTGGYREYGFGGFVYERNGGTDIPDSGQATFRGDYTGVRVFDNAGGLEYTTGTMRMDIDFQDFNANDAVKATIFNRAAYDEQGGVIQEGLGEGELYLPDVSWVIQEGSPSLDRNGEITGEMFSVKPNDAGVDEDYETGTFNGILAGDARADGQGGEIVGVVVLESDDPRSEGVRAQETGGVIMYR